MHSLVGKPRTELTVDLKQAIVLTARNPQQARGKCSPSRPGSPLGCQTGGCANGMPLKTAPPGGGRSWPQIWPPETVTIGAVVPFSEQAAFDPKNAAVMPVKKPSFRISGLPTIHAPLEIDSRC